MMRIFVAIDISDEAREAAAARIALLRARFPRLRVGWERPEKLHLTLKFLGDTDENRLHLLTDAVVKTAKQAAPFQLRLERCGVFPSEKRAKILWIGIDDPENGAKDLHALLETECERAGIARETRDFKPHLTIARLREPQNSRLLAEEHLRTQFEPVGFEVSEIVIYESRLQPSDSVYSPISRHRLNG